MSSALGATQAPPVADSLILKGEKKMSLITTIEIIKKELYPESVVLLKVGTFYHAYFKDAILLSYLFGYKLKKLEKNVSNCGFPAVVLNNVKYLLEQKKINYLIIDRAHNYEEDEKEDFKGENSYMECYEKANRYILLKERVDRINDFLIEHINEESINNVLDRMECVIYEKG